MLDYSEDVASLRSQLVAVGQKLGSDSGEKSYTKTLASIRRLLDSLSEEFDQPHAPGTKRRSLGQMARSLKYQKEVRGKLESALTRERGERLGGRIQALWFVRVCMAKPSIPLRTIANFCRDFPIQETKQICHTTVSHTRDGFVELVKQMNKRCVELCAKDNLSEGGLPGQAAGVLL